MILAALLLAAAAPAHAAFNPVEFFRGRTHGDGTLKIIFQASKRINVDSVGRAEKDGSLMLEQVIHEPGKPARTRYWRLRQTAPDRFEGTLTDAAGPVRVDVEGDRVRIRYKGKDHLDFDQWLTPAGPDAGQQQDAGQTLRNHRRPFQRSDPQAGLNLRQPVAGRTGFRTGAARPPGYRRPRRSEGRSGSIPSPRNRPSTNDRPVASFAGQTNRFTVCSRR